MLVVLFFVNVAQRCQASHVKLFYVKM
jgi:hypothetical protein